MTAELHTLDSGGDGTPLVVIPEIAWVDYSIKLAISLLLFLPLYGLLLGWLSRRLVAWTGQRDRDPAMAQ